MIERQQMQAREHHISHDHIHRKEDYVRRIRRIERQTVVQRTAVGFSYSGAPAPTAPLPSRTADFITAPPMA
ncbi:hypothetical protein [Mycolicibacterium lutetiense]|uniref:Uncharacterized protein n=1 Tax=Mycolicibacterium lutetiense TaxID=1641992 RepID=A0ABS4ZLB7_9MYCO|nr:hypothetical protein [Mycolicibacterium lutetiense]MBP2450285.1 hypothetical protein [Mycolicibacterium lutetiense]